MAIAVMMPRQGNTVETCQILEWKKSPGDSVKEGEVVCIVETDKATFEVEAPGTGTLLEHFFAEGDDVPVLTNIAAIGKEGENPESLKPNGTVTVSPGDTASAADDSVVEVTRGQESPPADGSTQESTNRIRISARARRLAEAQGIRFDTVEGTGPAGRIIERDILSRIASQQPLTPAAKEVLASSYRQVPESGTGIGGRIRSADLESAPVQIPERVTTVEVKGVRRRIAERMLNSLQSTAQLTMNTHADARALLDYRRKLKTSPDKFHLSKITINDLVLFATAKVLPWYSDVNALFDGDSIQQFDDVHLAFAVDTLRGLLVPVIRNAHALSLKDLADKSGQLVEACQEGTVLPDDLQGGTFTVTNLGALGIESFTPILNLPQVAILGVGGTDLKPIEEEGEVRFVPHVGLSLTVNHQVVDGAPAARFLRELSEGIANIELMLSI